MTVTAQIVLPRFRSPPLYEISRGPEVVQWVRDFMTTRKGPKAGLPMDMLLWEQWVLNELLEVDPETGYRRYRRGLIGVGRQNGKSTIGQSLATHGLFRAPPGSEIYSCAGDKNQARIVFGEVREQILNHPFLATEAKVYKDAIEVPRLNTVYRVLSADAKLQQGLSPWLTVFDEVHVQKDDELWDAMAFGMGARPDAQILGITTAGVEPTSLCGRLYAYGKRIAEGEVDDDSFGFWWWEPHAEDCDIFDTDAWSQANPAMIEGILLESDLHSAALSSHPSSFRRYRLNQWVPGAGAGWMPMDRWDHAADKERKLKPGATIIILFDGSVDADATSMGVLDISDPENPHYVQVAVWEPPITGPEVENWSVPRIEVHAQLERLFREFDVRVFLGDPAWWRSEFQAWQDRFGVNKVLEWPVTNQRMGPACSEAYKRVVEQRISHDGSPTLRRHVANARVKPLPARDMYTIKKETPHSPRKIDCAVTFIMAIDGLDRFADEGPSAELLVF